MNARYLVILPCYLLLSCGKETIIEEKFPEVSLARKQKEQQSTEQLSGHLSEINDKTQALSDFAVDVEQDLKEISQLFQSLESIDLLDADQTVSAADSEKYQQFYEKSDDLLAKINAKNCDEIYKKVYELVEISLIEQKLLSDSLLVRKEVDQINDQSLVAKDKKKKIDEAFSLLQSQKKSIGNKIDQASVNFGAQFGDRGAILAEMQTNASKARSLANIDAILAEPRIFSLETEIQADNVNGPNLFKAIDKLPELFSKLKMQALETKTNIDNQFNKIPTSQQEVENLARALDLSLENQNNELAIFTTNQGITPAHIVRRAALNILLNPHKTAADPGLATPPTPAPAAEAPPPPPPGPGSPPTPPAPGAAITAKPAILLAALKEALNKINYIQPDQVENSIKTALNKLSFYEPRRLAKIIAAVSKAKDPKSYAPTYQKLSDLVSLYTIDGIKNLLDEGGAKASDNEILFSANLAKLKNYLSSALFSLVENGKKAMVDKRISLLKNHINNIESIKKLDELMSRLEKDRSGQKIPDICSEINQTNHLLNQLPCDSIKKEFEPDDTNPRSAIAELQAATVAREKVGGRYIALKESINNALNKTELFAAVRNLNIILANKLDYEKFPSGEDYTVDTLINDTLNSISSNYEKAITEFSKLLSSTMTEQEIENIGEKLAKGSKDPLAKNLASVLSSEAYLQFSTQFDSPTYQVLIAAMKNTALASQLNSSTGEEIGIADFFAAQQAVYDASDDITSAEALNKFAQFFKLELSNKIKEIASLKATILTIEQQISAIKNLTEKNQKYLAIKFISELENNIKNIEIISDSKNSLEEKISILPSTLKSMISETNSPVYQFKLLKEALLRAISALALSSPPAGTQLLAADKTNIEPIVNAFSLVFLHLINKLEPLNFDGSDDNIIAQITKLLKSPYLATYVSKFRKFKSVVGEDNRNIIDKIKNVKNKLNVSRPETAELIIFINNLLQ